MPFDEEELDPHGECTAEIHRLREEIAALKRDLLKAVERWQKAEAEIEQPRLNSSRQEHHS